MADDLTSNASPNPYNQLDEYLVMPGGAEEPPRTDIVGNPLDKWGLPTDPALRALMLATAGKVDPEIDPKAWQA